MKTLSKLLIVVISSTIALTSFAGWGWFNSHYDPYYGNRGYYSEGYNYDRYYDGCHHAKKCGHMKHEGVYHKCKKCKKGCMRAKYKSATCLKVKRVNNCGKVVSISKFTKREMHKAPYQPMSALYVNVFRGWF